MHAITQIFHYINPLSPETVTDFESIFQYQEMKKGQFLLEIGKKATHMYYVQKGLIRALYYHDGKDVTDYFAIDGQFIGAVPSLFTGLPSSKAIQLIEDSQIYGIPSVDFEACCGRHHDLERATRRIVSFALVEEQQRIESLRFYSAKERYDLMEKKYPGISNRSPLQYIASYIGTSPVSLSRIRAGIQ